MSRADFDALWDDHCSQTQLVAITAAEWKRRHAEYRARVARMHAAVAEGLGEDELSERFGLPPSTASTYLHRIRRGIL